jgi:hypothetical protein
MQFNDTYKHFLNSYLCENKDLPQDVFYYPALTTDPLAQRHLLHKNKIQPVLNDLVRDHILIDIEALNSTDIQNTRRVIDYVLVGDCLKPFFTVKQDAPLDIVVYFDYNECSSILHGRLDKTLQTINGRLIPGTKRKIFYHLRSEPIKLQDYSQVYHPFTSKWLKETNTNLEL